MKIKLLFLAGFAFLSLVGCISYRAVETSTEKSAEKNKQPEKSEPAHEQLVIPPRPTGNPDYKGKKVSYWISQFQKNGERRQEAIVALRHIGSHAVPALTDMLQTTTEKDRKDAIVLLGVVGLHAGETVPTLLELAEVAKEVEGKTVYPHREAVLDTLGQIGPEAGKAAPKLLAWLNNESLSPKEEIKAAVALWLIGEKHEPVAREALLKHAGGGNFEAFVALGRFGPRAKKALPELRSLLKHDNDAIRLDAAGTIWAISQEPKAILPALIEVYQNPKIKIPLIDRIIWLLGEMGPAAQPMAPYLVKDVKSHKQYYWKLAPTLFKIDPWEAKKAGILAPFAARGKQLKVMYENRPLEAWIRDLQYSDYVVFSNAAAALKKLGDEAEASVPYLVHAYNYAPVKSGIPKAAYETLVELAPAEAEQLDPQVLERPADG